MPLVLWQQNEDMASGFIVLRSSLHHFQPRPALSGVSLFKLISKQLLPEGAFTVVPSLHSSFPKQPSVGDFVWTGTVHAVEFRVRCLPGVASGVFDCEAMVIEGGNVKRLTFTIEVAEPGCVPRALDAGREGVVELNTVVEEVKGNVAEVPYDELVFVRELGRGVQVRKGWEIDRRRRANHRRFQVWVCLGLSCASLSERSYIGHCLYLVAWVVAPMVHAGILCCCAVACGSDDGTGFSLWLCFPEIRPQCAG